MTLVRHLFAQRHIALWICAATLLLRLLVPTGYMVGWDHGQVGVTLCPGIATVATSAPPHHMHAATSRHHPSPDHDREDMPCAFAGLSTAMLGAADPVLLAGLIAFVLTLGIRPQRSMRRSAPTCRWPPLRGPPAHI